MMWRVPLLIIIGTFIGNGQTLAGTFVEFPNLSGREPAHLIGYLARPDAGLSALMSTARDDAAAPYPAVVMLHGCGGTSSHSASIADRLGAWGYVALAIDTLGSRGRTSDCSSGILLEQASDAYAALHYLSTLEIVDAERVALFGQSSGGTAVLYAIEREEAVRYDQRFHAAIAYYPSCSIVGAAVMTAPLLILIGEVDEWTSADDCQTLRDRARPKGVLIGLTVYPGVHHAFDVAQLKPGRRSLGRWLEYDARAARDAEDKTLAFLADHLVRMPVAPQPRPP
jgi:dienelactone hydrolase